MPTADVSARLAWPEDAPAVAALQLRVWNRRDVDATEHAERWEATLTRSPEARFRVLVALEGRLVRGVVVTHPNTDPDADRVTDGEIAELLVDPTFRGQGHGSRLLQAAADTLTADRFTRARWWIGASDDAVRRFATAAGWAPDGAHRTLSDDDGTTIRQVRLHTALGGP